jgi:hypothetical protein
MPVAVAVVATTAIPVAVMAMTSDATGGWAGCKFCGGPLPVMAALEANTATPIAWSKDSGISATCLQWWLQIPGLRSSFSGGRRLNRDVVAD